MRDPREIERLFKAHFARMHRLALAMVRDDELARDIVHDLFASLLDTGAADTPVPTEGYLLRAVRNRCLNHIRDLGIRERIMNLYLPTVDEYDSEVWPDEETIAVLRSAVASELTPQGRAVVEMRFGRGMKFGEIASAMGLSETAVYRHMHTALARLRAKLTRESCEGS